MSFKPSYSEVMTAPDAEREFSGFTFKGPGFYHYKHDTMLVIPVDRPEAETWHQAAKPGEKFHFHIYNGRNPAAAFNLIANAPTRD